MPNDDVTWTPAVSVGGADPARYDLPGSHLMPPPNGGGGVDGGTPVKIAAGASPVTGGTPPNTTISGGDNWNQLVGVVNYRLNKLLNAGVPLPPLGLAAVVTGAGTVKITEQTHVLDMRTRIDYIRTNEGSPQFTWTDFNANPPYANTQSVVMGYHLAELRKALAGKYLQAQMSDSFRVQSNTLTNQIFPKWFTLRPCVQSNCFTWDGLVNINIHATNANGSSPTSTLKLYVSDTSPTNLPYMTSSIQTYTPKGDPFSYQVTGANFPTTFSATGLPAGTSMSGSGLITGVVGTAGNYTVNITLSNAGGFTAVGQLIIVCEDLSGTPPPPKPVLSSPAGANGIYGSFFSYQITSDIGTTYFATGLPPSLSVDPVTGIISGTLNHAEWIDNGSCTPSYLSNGYGASADWIVIAGNRTTSVNPTLFQVTRSTASFLVANPIDGTIPANLLSQIGNNHLSGNQKYQVNPFLGYSPAYLNIDFSLFASGYANVPGIQFWVGDYGSDNTGFREVNISSTNGATARFVMTTGSATSRVTSALNVSGIVGSPFSHTITATSGFTAQARTPLPPGLTMTTAGVISGTPTTAGATTVLIVLNDNSYYYLKIIIQVSGTPAMITSAGEALYTPGTPFSYTITSNQAGTFSASPLAPGLTLAGAVISGTVPTHTYPTCPGNFPDSYDPIDFLLAGNSNVGDTMHLAYTSTGAETNKVQVDLSFLPGGGIKSNHTYLIHMKLEDDDNEDDATAQYLIYTGTYIAPQQTQMIVNAIQLEVHWDNLAGPG